MLYGRLLSQGLREAPPKTTPANSRFVFQALRAFGTAAPFYSAAVEYGDNRLSITLTGNDPEAKSPTMVIDEVEVYVEPRSCDAPQGKSSKLSY